MSGTDAGERSDQPVQPPTPSAEPRTERGSATPADRPGSTESSPAPHSGGTAIAGRAAAGRGGGASQGPEGSGRSEASGSSDASGGSGGSGSDGETGDGSREGGEAKKRRRGSRGGRNRNRNRPRPEGQEDGDQSASDGSDTDDTRPSSAEGGDRPPREVRSPRSTSAGSDRQPELPDRHRENKPSAEAAEAALVRKPKIGDSRPAPAVTAERSADEDQDGGEGGSSKRRRRRGGRGRGGSAGGGSGSDSGRSADGAKGSSPSSTSSAGGSKPGGRDRSERSDRGDRDRSGRGRGGRSRGAAGPPVTAITDDEPIDLDEKTLRKRRGRERKGKPVGRYLMAVHVQAGATQIAVLEGRSLIEHYVSRPSDGVNQIHGNVYLGKVQNVLPGMEAAFVDIGTPKNAVLYRSDTRHDPEDLDRNSDTKAKDLRIEQILRARQTIISQVTKNPIGAKGARLTQEVSLPGRFVVLVPNSTTYGISKRLPDSERKRLRQILDRVKPKGHGLIVRTAAEGISAEELERDVQRLAAQWSRIEELGAKSQAPALLYQEPDMAVRVIREEFNADYRQVVIDDDKLFEEVRDYVRSISPALVDRVERYDPAAHGDLPIFEAHHVHEQLHKALDRKVWLPSGGSLIIERTEALTVIDVNTGKNVGKSSLEETVFRNNLEAAEEVARQLRLRDIGGIIVIDFIDMEIRGNREKVISTFREALSRDKTRTQVFDISELGLVEMTRKRIGEGLMESLSGPCPNCEGRGMVFDRELIGD